CLLPAGSRPAGDVEGLRCPLVGFCVASRQHEGARLGTQHAGRHLRLPVVTDELDRPFVGDEGVLAGAGVPQVAPEPPPYGGSAPRGGPVTEGPGGRSGERRSTLVVTGEVGALRSQEP